METEVEIKSSGRKILGKYRKGKSNHLIIVCHGYKGSMLHATISAFVKSVDRNSSTYRFDFPTGSDKAISFDFEKQVQDIGAILKHFRKTYADITLIGVSFSAFLVVIASTKYKVSRIVTINGVFYLEQLGGNYWKFAFSSLFDKGIRRQLTFYQKNFKPKAVFVPVLIVHSINDKQVNLAQSIRFFSELNTKRKIELIYDSDHEILSKESRTAVLRKVLRWIHHKLLKLKIRIKD